MRFTCEKSMLVQGLNIAGRTVAQKSSLSVIEGILCKAGHGLSLTGYNMETAITYEIEAEISDPGHCILPAKLFGDIIRRLPEGPVTVVVDDAFKVSIRAGYASFTISAESAEDYPELPDVNEGRTIASMLITGKRANELKHPVVLDPVGAGASKLRTETAMKLLEEVKFTVIRGNISEIKTLASGSGTTKGVDADVADKVTEENLNDVAVFAKAFAEKTGAVIAITGAIDIVADRNKAYCIRNGHPMMSSITGTGCQLSAMTAAFVTANPDHPLEAAAAAVSAMGYAGEVAHSRLTAMDGNSTYRNCIIDAIYNMTPEDLEEGANYEVR